MSIVPRPRDLAQALRRLRKTPSFTALTLLTLGLGLGAVVAIGTVVYGVLLSPLPYEDADRLAVVWHSAPNIGVDQVPNSHGSYALYRRDVGAFEETALYDGGFATLTGAGRPERLDVLTVSSTLLPVLGVEPLLGRNFLPEEDQPGAPNTVMLSHGLWVERFGGDESVVGRTLTLDGEPWEVIGVTPADFNFPDDEVQLYMPHPISQESLAQIGFSYRVVARLRPDATPEAVDAELARVLDTLPEAFPGELTRTIFDGVGMTVSAIPLRDELVGDVGDVLWVLLAAAAILLAVAAANVANLYLARAEGRQREVAVATALGASRADLVRGHLAEALWLAGGAGIAALGLAALLTELLPRWAPEGLPRLHAIGLAPPVVAATLGMTVVLAVVLAMIPWLRFRKLELSTSLKEGGRGGDAGRATRWSRNALVVGQVAASLVLLAGSVLALTSFRELTRVDPGFSREGVLTFRVALSPAEYPERAEVNGFLTRLQGRLEALPGVETVAYANFRPLTDGMNNSALTIEGFEVPEGALPPVLRFQTVSPGYPETMGIPLLAGRDLDPRALDGQPAEVLVSAALARRYWPDGEAVGKQVWPGDGRGSAYTVVGVLGDVHDESLMEDAEAMVYFPPNPVPPPEGVEDADAQGWMLRSPAVVLKVAGTPEALIPVVRQTVWDLDSNLPLMSVETTAELVGRATARSAFTATLLALAALAALLLGTIGLYAVVSYLVSRRTREIGVRMALGADRGSVQAMVVRQGLALAALGVGLGLVAAVWVARALTALLYGVEAGSPLPYAVAGALLLTVASLASWVPARRASGVDPAVALTGE